MCKKNFSPVVSILMSTPSVSEWLLLMKAIIYDAFMEHLFNQNYCMVIIYIYFFLSFILLSDMQLPVEKLFSCIYLLSLPLLLMLARCFLPSSHDQCFLIRPTSHCLYLCLSLHDLNSEASSHLLLSLHLSASLARWSFVELRANVCEQ